MAALEMLCASSLCALLAAWITARRLGAYDAPPLLRAFDFARRGAAVLCFAAEVLP